MNLLRENPIVIKKGINYPMIVGSVIAFAVIVIMGTSNMWLPDGRDIMNRGLKEGLIFNGVAVKIDNQIYRDGELGLGEIRLKVDCSVDTGKDLKFAVLKDGVVKYPNDSYKVIKGSKLPVDENGNDTYQEIIVQFAVPKDFYYISVVVEQVDNRKDQFDIDYRLFNDKKLSEKDNDYLKAFDDINLKNSSFVYAEGNVKKELSGFEKTCEHLQSEIKQLKTQISITKDEAVKTQRSDLLLVKENDLVSAKSLLEEKKIALKDLDKELKVAKHEKAAKG